MAKQAYVEKKFTEASLNRIELANSIIDEYQAQGFALTLRQLYYQFVARDLIPNQQKEYNKLGSLISDARMAGLVDWNAIEDRTRYTRSLAHWDSPSEIVDACAAQFRVDKWANQEWRPTVWIEKDALIGVIEGVCNKLDVPYFSCRGYTSQSEMWSNAQSFLSYAEGGQRPIILHFGDHDPSGIDMTRDIRERLELFTDGAMKIERLALNFDQIQKYNPPPNPAKSTDSRYSGYIAEYGDESWELDAMEPKVLVALVEKKITSLIDQDKWDESMERQSAGRAKLREIARTM